MGTTAANTVSSCDASQLWSGFGLLVEDKEQRWSYGHHALMHTETLTLQRGRREGARHLLTSPPTVSSTSPGSCWLPGFVHQHKEKRPSDLRVEKAHAAPPPKKINLKMGRSLKISNDSPREKHKQEQHCMLLTWVA